MGLIPKNKDLGWTPYAWTCYMLFFLGYPALDPRTTTATWIITIAAAIVFLALYFRGYWAKDRERQWIIVAMTVMAVALYPFNPGAGSFFIYAASFAGYFASNRRAIWNLAVLELIVITESLWFHMHPFQYFWPVAFTALIGGTNMHQASVKRSNARLRLAHDEIEHLAKVAERERIARDLHDLLGHTLSLIVLKSELASKLASRDVERAAGEIRDVERISRDALAQVRSAVRGYRCGGLQSELDDARATLTTAGMTLSMEIEPGPLPAAQEAVLALAIREAITNIVRHSRASQVAIELHRSDGKLTLRVTDDGRGGEAPFGSGLSGMQERIESLSGVLTRDGSRGTTLTITLPGPVNRELTQTA